MFMGLARKPDAERQDLTSMREGHDQRVRAGECRVVAEARSGVRQSVRKHEPIKSVSVCGPSGHLLMKSAIMTATPVQPCRDRDRDKGVNVRPGHAGAYFGLLCLASCLHARSK